MEREVDRSRIGAAAHTLVFRAKAAGTTDVVVEVTGASPEARKAATYRVEISAP